MSLMGGLSAGMGAVGMLSGLNTGRQIETQQKLTDQQVEAQKKLGKFNANQAKMMWDATNYGAQVQHMKDAGLSVSTLMGKGGAGGATTQGTGAGSVTGGQAETPSQGLMAKTAAAQSLANIELTKAQTNKTNKETENLEGTGKGIGLDNIAKEFQNQFNIDSRENNLNAIASYASKLLGEANEANVKGAIAEGTQIEQQQKIKEEAIGAMLNNMATINGINKNEEEIKKWSQEIAQKWEELRLKGESNNIEKFKAEVNANLPSVLGVLGGKADEFFRALDKLTPNNPIESNKRKVK